MPPTTIAGIMRLRAERIATSLRLRRAGVISAAGLRQRVHLHNLAAAERISQLEAQPWN